MKIELESEVFGSAKVSNGRNVIDFKRFGIFQPNRNTKPRRHPNGSIWGGLGDLLGDIGRKKSRSEANERSEDGKTSERRGNKSPRVDYVVLALGRGRFIHP